MPYMPQTGVSPIDRAVVEALARAAGLEVAPEDVGPLTATLAEQLALIDRLSRLNLVDVEPTIPFDPRWPEDGAGAQRGN